MDWNLARRTAEQMLKICEKEKGAGLMTMLAAMLLVVASFDDSTKEIAADRPDNLTQVYGWTMDCLKSLQLAYPDKPEKPN